MPILGRFHNGVNVSYFQ